LHEKGEGYYEYNSLHGFIEGDQLYEYDMNPVGIPDEVVSAIEGHLRKPLIVEYWNTPRALGDNWFGDEEDYHENSFGDQPWWSWWRQSAFENGGFVRNKIKVIGQDDRGNSYAVPRNTVGEVLYSDEMTSIVIFNLPSGPLGAHLIRVEETTDKFMPAPANLVDRGPAPRRRR
jgi:hypothetical protein